MNDTFLDHYNRPEVRQAVIDFCQSGTSQRALNTDKRWYIGGKIESNVRLRGIRDYDNSIARGRTLYATLNLFLPEVFEQEEKWDEKRGEPVIPIGSNHNTFAYMPSVDIDGIGDIKNLAVKEAVEAAGQYFVDFLASHGVKKSVHCLFSGGGIYVHIHHGLWVAHVEWSADKRREIFGTLEKAYNRLIEDVSREFFREHPEHIGRVKFDKLNNAKRIFKTIFSIHAKHDYAVVPLDRENIKIDLVRAGLPLSDDVLADGLTWYKEFDVSERESLTSILEEKIEEVEKICSSRIYTGDGTISRREEALDYAEFPPCIVNICEKATAKEGKHRALGVLATFLYQVGWSEDDSRQLWDEVAERCGVDARIFETEWGRVCCPNCATMPRDTGGYPNLNLHKLGFCVTDLGCKEAGWPGEYDAWAMTEARNTQFTQKESSPNTSDDTNTPMRPRNNQGNVEWLVELHGQDLKFVRQYADWVWWTGKKWQRDETAINRALKDVVKVLYEVARNTVNDTDRSLASKFASACGNNGVYNATAELASKDANFSVSVLDFDKDPFALNMNNGVLDLKSRTLRKHSSQDRFLKIIPYDFDSAATCPRWIKFLNETYGGDQDLIAYFQRVVGRALTGDNSDKAFFFMFGPEGDNGKSKILEVLRALLGEYSYHADISTFLKSRNEKGVREDLVPFYGMRVITSTEPEEGTRFELGLIKIITGGDPINCRELYGKHIVFTPTCKLFFAANNRPAIVDRSEAAWSRVHVIPHDISVPKDKQDKQLGGKLKLELPGILNWALEGLKKYFEIGGLSPPARVVNAVKDYRIENDTVKQFLDEVCTFKSTNSMPGPELYNSYKEYCLNFGRKPLGLGKFNKSMLDSTVTKGVTRTKEATGYIWDGISAPYASGYSQRY